MAGQAPGRLIVAWRAARNEGVLERFFSSLPSMKAK
jgi:hypothetical protein